MNRNLYMHTINSRPAFYTGEQIVVAFSGVKFPDLFVQDLKTIRQQQRASAKYRNERGWGSYGTLGYLRIRDI